MDSTYYQIKGVNALLSKTRSPSVTAIFGNIKDTLHGRGEHGQIQPTIEM